MKKPTLAQAALAALTLSLSLGACSDSAEEAGSAEIVVAGDDHDAPEPVAEAAHDHAEPHDESVPHTH